MADLNFRCFKCGELSPMTLKAESRDHMQRLRGDPNLPREVTFYCSHCGAANSIALSVEALTALAGTLSSDDPDVQKAIENAKRGDYNSAIEEARRRFRF